MTSAPDWEAEIRDLHDFFGAWFRGDVASSDTEFERCRGVLDPDFTMVTPDGAVLTAARVLGGIRGGYGRRRVHISIENPTLLWSKCNDVAARYEEWQQTDGAGVDRVGRVSTVVFARDSSMPHGLRWLTVHETWLASQHTS